MPNVFWYVGLAVVSVCLIGYTLWKTRDGRLLALHFCLAGLIDPLEYFVLILFSSYQYFPTAISDVWIDNIIGAIASNDLIIPAVAVAAAAFRLRLAWLLVLSVLFMGVEWLFLHLDLFGLFWWKTMYTGIGIFLFFLIGQYLWRTIQRGHASKPFLFFYTFFVYLFVYGTSHIIQGHFLDIHDLKVGWFPDPIRDQLAFGELIEIFASLITAAAYFMAPVAKLAMLACLVGFDVLLLLLDVITVDRRGEFAFFVLLQLVSFYAVHGIVKYGTRSNAS